MSYNSNTQQPSIRDAEKSDLFAIQTLLKSLNLPTEEVESHLQNFIVLVKDGKLIGTVGLEIYDNKALLRSLAVTKEHQRKGHGRRLYQSIISKARQLDISELYLLTETAEKFFSALGFEKISRESADAKVKTSIEFRSVCPDSAVCMRLRLS